jgi:hypothetical protein
MSKINTQTVKKAHDSALELVLKGVAASIVILPVVAMIIEAEPEQTAQASELPELPIMEDRYSPPPKPEIPLEVEEVEAEPKSKPSKPFLTDEAKQKMAERIDGLLVEQGSPMAGQGKAFVDLSVKYNRHPYAVVAITGADSSFGKQLLTPYNPGNYGNNDRGDKVAFSSWPEGIEAIYRALTNNNLKNATKLCHLSYGGRKNCPEGAKLNGGKIYASSPENWERNTNYWFSWLLGTEYKISHSIILSDHYKTNLG